MKTKKQKKLTYKEMLAVLGEFRKEVLIMRNEMSSIHFLINSLLEMNGDVEKLTDFIEGKVVKEKNKSAEGKKEQAEGSRAPKTSSKSG